MRETTSVKAMMKGTSSMKDAMRDFADQVAAIEKNVMTVVLDATEKLARLTNCQSFLMFESKGRRYFCGSEDLCHLYLTSGLKSRDSDKRLAILEYRTQKVSFLFSYFFPIIFCYIIHIKLTLTLNSILTPSLTPSKFNTVI